MNIKRLSLAVLAALLAIPALAHDGPHIENAYARIGSSGSGAVFFDIVNHSDQPDRLVSATSDVAAKVELHTHVQDASGVMRMIEVKDGIPFGGKETRTLQRGGDHVMLMGVSRPLAQGDVFNVTLTFERGEVITIEVPVDNDRKPAHGAMTHDHSGHAGHGAPSN
jgi:periplasmic copper chaperone A